MAGLRIQSTSAVGGGPCVGVQWVMCCWRSMQISFRGVWCNTLCVCVSSTSDIIILYKFHYILFQGEDGQRLGSKL